MGYTLTGHHLASDVVFMTLAFFSGLMLNVTIRIPFSITTLAELKVTLGRIQVIGHKSRPSHVKLPYHSSVNIWSYKLK